MSVTVEEEIRRRIREVGPITFAKFMELALYWPKGGYYSGTTPVGRSGDFYTSPGAHPAFGGLLAIQIYQMWRLLGSPSPFWVVEPGAGDGLLCHDIVSYSLNLPEDFNSCLRYVCIDGGVVSGFEDHLPSSLRSKVDRIVGRDIPLNGFEGCIVSNELVDAFPVHRVVMTDGRLCEIYVNLDGDAYVEEVGEPSTEALGERFDKLEIGLAEGQVAEVNLAIETWLEDVVSSLVRGYVLTIDYGRHAEELYSEERLRGTLTCFYKHLQTDDPYSRVGEQDISSQVDFSTLHGLGNGLGLEPLMYLSQSQFLTNLGLRRMMNGLYSTSLSQQTRDANRTGMLDLIRPGGLGEFKVLIQQRNAPASPLWGIQSDESLEELREGLPVPLLTALHMPLLQGRHPDLAAVWDNLEAL